MVHGSFRHLVGQSPGVCPQASNAGDVDYAALPVHEVWETLLAESHGGFEVDLHAQVNVLHGDLLEVSPGEDPSIINQHVETSKILQSFPDGLPTLLLGLEVGLEQENVVPRTASHLTPLTGGLQAIQIATQQG